MSASRCSNAYYLAGYAQKEKAFHIKVAREGTKTQKQEAEMLVEDSARVFRPGRWR